MNAVEVKTTSVRYAGFWRRLAAFLIDDTLIGVICWLLSFFGILGLALMFLFVIAYYIGFWSWLGQTPGKAALGVKVVRQDGTALSFGNAVLRYIGYFVSSLIFYIGFLMIGFHDQKKGLHDLIAGTQVIIVPSIFAGIYSRDDFDSTLAESEEIHREYHGI